MTTRVQNAIDVFLDALNEGTLAKGTCVACAVGNLVAAGLGAKIFKERGFFRCDTDNYSWSDIFATTWGGQNKRFGLLESNNPDIIKIKKMMETTGFTPQELAKIEFAFETNCSIPHNRYFQHSKKEIRQDQIKGLKAVVEVMMTFDDIKEDVNEVFTKKAELIPV